MAILCYCLLRQVDELKEIVLFGCVHTAGDSDPNLIQP